MAADIRTCVTKVELLWAGLDTIKQLLIDMCHGMLQALKGEWELLGCVWLEDKDVMKRPHCQGAES